MAYNNVTDAGDMGNLIPVDTATEILKNVPTQSAALQLFRKTPLSTRTLRQNVLAALPVAFFVNGDTGLKQTTELGFSSVDFVVEEIATLLPVPQNVIDDSDYDILNESRPLIEEAIGRTIDNAIFFGVNKPASWPAAISPAAVTADNTISVLPADVPGGAVASGVTWGMRYEDKISQTFSLVEDDGFTPNGVVIPRGLKGRFRMARDSNGTKLFDNGLASYNGIDFAVAMDSMWPTGDLRTEMIVGDFTKGIIGIRKDITYELFREGVITDNGSPPVILYNLMQQDMVVMRVTMRLAWVVSNPISLANTNASTRYPFAVMRYDEP